MGYINYVISDTYNPSSEIALRHKNQIVFSLFLKKS